LYLDAITIDIRGGTAMSKKLLLAASAAIALGAMGHAKADDIIFNDLGDSPTLTKDPPEGQGSISIESGGVPDQGSASCKGETCSIEIRGENNFLLGSVTPLFGITRVDANHFYMTVLEANRSISDVVLVDTTNASSPPGTPDQGAVLTFLSDTTSGLSGFKIAENSPVENGSLQHLLSLSWQDPGVTADVADVWVASDLNVPEPSTWAMMLAGFVGLGLVAFRRRRREAISRVFG
jgi:hypothetical protein